MKFSLFNPWPVYGVPSSGEWPVAPALSEPSGTLAGMRHGFDISQLADRVGFDYITVAEHHYHPRQLSPNAILSGAALAQHLHRAGVAVLGATLPLVNPLRTAEELSVLDAMTNGNLLVGLFRGTPNEFLTYGTNPNESREVFEEAVSLILEAWTQPEPFSWVGRHYDFRVVSVWPRPVSVPYPPILVSANSPTSATYAAKNHFKVGISFFPADRTTTLVSFFKEEAERFGWSPEPDDILHRAFIALAETDEAAEELVGRYGLGDPSKMINPKDAAVMGALNQAMGPGTADRAAPGGPGAKSKPMGTGRPTFVGSPDTVAAQIREFAERTGVGHFDLVFNDVVVPFDDACRGVRLFGEEVIPQLMGSTSMTEGRDSRLVGRPA